MVSKEIKSYQKSLSDAGNASEEEILQRRLLSACWIGIKIKNMEKLVKCDISFRKSIIENFPSKIIIIRKYMFLKKVYKKKLQ